jgi:solute:Na+ symporter, SSS family
MTSHFDWTAVAVFLFFLIVITVIAFLASRWKRGDSSKLEEWGLAGRRFGTLITWFLLGGDLFTAYTMIAVPGLVYGTGALGFFALPYTTITLSFAYVTMPRLWAVCRKHHYVTAADFVRGRYGSRTLALAIAVTGILATLPYIALQLIGIQVSIAALGITGPRWIGQLPLIIAFLTLATCTYIGGLRAPASIAFIKDTMVYIVVLAATIYLPMKLGGYAHIFQAAGKALLERPHPASLLLQPGQHLPFATLIVGSAIALFLYPHSVTGILSSSSENAIKRNAALLPVFTLMLGMIALLGYGALAVGVTVSSSNYVIPALFLKIFPPWFVGFCFASIVVGALVPAAIMSIAAANLFTRNIYREFLARDINQQRETSVAKMVSVILSFGALAFVLFLPTEYATNLQLLGGVWIIQTFPAIIIGLFTGWFKPFALIFGWAAGMAIGTVMVMFQHLSPIFTVQLRNIRFASYAAVDALVVNLMFAFVLTFLLNSVRYAARVDETHFDDYTERDLEISGLP